MTHPASVTTFDRALCRLPSASVVSGLRAENRGDPRFEAVVAEHAAYVEALRGAGVTVDVLEPLDACPDAVFVEDPALVFTTGAILLRPGAPSRSGETEALAPALRERFSTVLTLAEGTADGGDVLTTPAVVMVGRSARTDDTGAAALVTALAALDRKAVIVDTPPGVLHFKSDCALLDDETVLVTGRLAASGVFASFRQIVVPDGEDAAANALRVNDRVLAGRNYPRTLALLDRQGYRVVPLDIAEIGKIDAGLSCMSLRWSAPVMLA